MTLTPANWITIAVVGIGLVSAAAMFKGDVLRFERFTEQREAEIWARIDVQEQEITKLKVRVSVLEALR